MWLIGFALLIGVVSLVLSLPTPPILNDVDNAECTPPCSVTSKCRRYGAYLKTERCQSQCLSDTGHLDTTCAAALQIEHTDAGFIDPSLINSPNCSPPCEAPSQCQKRRGFKYTFVCSHPCSRIDGVIDHECVAFYGGGTRSTEAPSLTSTPVPATETLLAASPTKAPPLTSTSVPATETVLASLPTNAPPQMAISSAPSQPSIEQSITVESVAVAATPSNLVMMMSEIPSPPPALPIPAPPTETTLEEPINQKNSTAPSMTDNPFLPWSISTISIAPVDTFNEGTSEGTLSHTWWTQLMGKSTSSPSLNNPTTTIEMPKATPAPPPSASPKPNWITKDAIPIRDLLMGVISVVLVCTICICLSGCIKGVCKWSKPTTPTDTMEMGEVRQRRRRPPGRIPYREELFEDGGNSIGGGDPPHPPPPANPIVPPNPPPHQGPHVVVIRRPQGPAVPVPAPRQVPQQVQVAQPAQAPQAVQAPVVQVQPPPPPAVVAPHAAAINGAPPPYVADRRHSQ